MNFLTFVLFSVLALVISTPAQTKISANDIKVLEGKQWIGNLTYLDYGSNKSTSIKSNLTVTRSKTASLVWVFDYQYPDEPNADRKSEVRLSPDGYVFNDAKIIERQNLPGGVRKIVTTKDGTDNDKPAVFRYTYLIGKNAFSIKKDARLEGSNDFFERNTYSWTR